jgi:hypothetical protein
MPQATDEQRAEWWPDSDPTGTNTAIKFLEAAGYSLRRDWCWEPPHPMRPTTEKERSAVFYLIDEWDFGGIFDPTTNSA